MADPLPVVVRKADFIREFQKLAPHRHRYEVFRDFVHMSAFSLVNAWPYTRSESIEAEFATIKAKYSPEEFTGFTRLLALLRELLEPEPRDILGQLYMSLELGNDHTGQFFTPPEVSEMMARMMVSSEGDPLRGKPFVTLSEPACGAGGMVLAFVKIMIEAKLNPMHRLWVHAQDVDRTAALMCYIQLSLWGVPAAVVVGNTLANEQREVFHTIGHHLGGWKWRLARQAAEQNAQKATTTPTDEAPATATTAPPEPRPFAPVVTSNQEQIGFEF